MKFSQTWILDTIFSGGSQSVELPPFLNALKKDMIALQETIHRDKALKQGILGLQNITERLEEADSYIGCLLAQNINDKQAEILQSKASELNAALINLSNVLDSELAQLSENAFKELLKDPDLAPIAFPLNEKRERQKEKLELPLENLITDLSIDGYHSWSHFYGTYLGEEVIPVKIKDKIEPLSWGQAYNRLSDPHRQVRQEVFNHSNKVWDSHKSVYGAILNHIAGFRLKVYEHRQWSYLKEPLEINRLNETSLNTMWEVIAANKTIFAECLKHKAKHIGLPKLSWYDLEAPLGLGAGDFEIPYDQGAEFIINQFRMYSPAMADFAHEALTERWIEAEDRKGKRPGGFCTGLPLKKQSRIFMTYSGTYESLFTLAHELGHAFHNHVIYNLPEMARHFPVNLAETASTFAEMVISEAAYKQETAPQRRLQLLNAKLQRSVVFLCNIHARFLFETRFYEERKKGVLSTDRLCSLMVDAQKEAYCDALDEYHPYFWASKMHFNSTGTPFYNFPYTFGYLFSLAVYRHAQLSSNFEQTYIDLLMDTGRMTSEEIAKKHLNADLSDRNFWQSLINILKQDAEEFLRT